MHTLLKSDYKLEGKNISSVLVIWHFLDLIIDYTIKHVSKIVNVLKPKRNEKYHIMLMFLKVKRRHAHVPIKTKAYNLTCQ